MTQPWGRVVEEGSGGDGMPGGAPVGFLFWVVAAALRRSPFFQSYSAAPWCIPFGVQWCTPFGVHHFLRGVHRPVRAVNRFPAAAQQSCAFPGWSRSFAQADLLGVSRGESLTQLRQQHVSTMRTERNMVKVPFIFDGGSST